MRWTLTWDILSNKNNGWACHKSTLGGFEKAVSLLARAPWLPGDILKFSITVTEHSQVDILKPALDAHDKDHIMVALPTGYGKTIPMLLLGHLLPAGTNSMTCQNSTFFPGSITIVVTPTTTIGQQLVADCHKLGITAVSGAQVMLDIFLAWHGIFPCLNLYMSSINHFPLPLT